MSWPWENVALQGMFNTILIKHYLILKDKNEHNLNFIIVNKFLYFL